MAQGGPANPKNQSYDFAPNQLDLYDNVSYNLKLYMIPEIDSINGNYDSENKVVIAETGVTTRILIDDLEIKSYIAPNRNIKNQESVRFDFVLREYYGAGLIDQIFVASQELGIKNYNKAPYYLEVSFAGRDRNSSSPDIESTSLRWVWPIFIRTIETEVDASGSLYNVEAYVYGNIAQLDDSGSIPKAVTVSGKTVGDALSDLQRQLNNMATQEALTNVTIPDVYKIDAESKINELLLVDDAYTYSPGWTSDLDDDDRTTREISLEKNLNIGEAINRIIAVSPEYQALCKNTNTASEQDVTDAEKTKQIHRIFASAKLNQFDIGRGDYSKTLSYNVNLYEMSTLQASVSESSANGKVKANELKSKGLIRKRYDYIYTGINDQVLDFDLRFNFGWYVNMPSQGGLFTQHSNAAEGQHVTNVYYEYLRIREEIAQARKLSQNAPSIANPNNEQEIQQQINDAELPPEEKEILQKLLSSAINPRLSSDNQTTYNERFSSGESRSSQGSVKSATPSQRFVSDYTVDKKSLSTAYKQYPLSYQENRKNDDDSDYSRSVEGNKGAGRPFVNSLFQQAFSGKTGDLVNVEIEVKGDPFWLESKEGIEAQGSVDSRSAQNSIVFSVQTADLPSESTGIVEHSNSPFSGVYAVRQVDHKFSGGKFTQTLYAVRDPNISVDDISEDLNV